MAPSRHLALLVLAACCAATALGQQYTPDTPVTRSYAANAARYGITVPEAAAGINPTLPENDPAVNYMLPDPEIPSQIHVFYHSTSEVLIQWFTGVPQQTNDTVSPFTRPDTGSASDVRYGSRLYLQYSTTGTKDYYRMTYPNTPIPSTANLVTVTPMTNFTNYTSGVIHRVILRNLQPSTTYWYQVGDFSRNKVSPLLSFRSLPTSGVTFKRVKFGVFADIAVSPNATRTVDRLVKANVDLALLAGDYAYANIYNAQGGFSYFLDDAHQYSHEVRWDMLGQMLQPLISKVPLLGCQGNHEREKVWDDGEEPHFRGWLKRYGNNMPWEASNGSPFYYSTNVGPVHVISISPYVDFSAKSAQQRWLEADLRSVDRTRTPWILATFHAPWYVTVVSHFQENECHRQIVEPLFKRYGVDFVINGHSHVYERSNKVYNYNVDRCGTTHLVVGNAGIGLNTAFADSAAFAPTLTNSSRFNASGPCPLPTAPSGVYVWLNTTQVCTHTYPNGNFCPSTQPEYSAVRDVSIGPTTIEFVNATHARVQYLRNADDDSVPPADDAWVVRDPSCAGSRK